MGCSASKEKSPAKAKSKKEKKPKTIDTSVENGQSQKQEKKNYPTQPMKPVDNVQPQQQQPPPPPQPSTPQADQSKEDNTVNLNDEEIKKRFNRYMEIEKEIAERESKNLSKAVQAKKEQAASLKKTLAETENHYKMACEKVAKEKADVDKMQNPSVKAFFKDQQEFDAKMSKEQEEYLEAVSEQEVAKKQLEGIQTQDAALTREVDEMSKELNSLMALYEEQDQILDEIFSGKYGSELENQLEQEVDSLLDRKERIAVAKYKWINGRLLLQHACNQLSFAVRRWQTVATVPPNNIPVKYQLATETRNNLIAASQNIMGAKRYLNSIKFPYCEPEEIATLDKACGNIYIDMQSHERHQHALQCYSVTYRRAAALLQWFDSVIHNTIDKDLANAKSELSPKGAALRKERLQLIKEKIGGDTSDIKMNEKDLDDFDDMMEPELLAISEPDRVEGESGGLTPGDELQAGVPTPLPLNELAPPPSQEALFGNIAELKKQHEEDMAQLQKTQETNKARMEQGLQEKLRRRRSRRRKMDGEEEQVDE